VAANAGAGLADYQRAASSLADTWGCVSVRAEQQGPGLRWATATTTRTRSSDLP
jgi:hypothetical protein